MLSVAEYMPIWWQNNRDKRSGGLRLTDTGFGALYDYRAGYVRHPLC